jgi:hypothetical protein
MANISKKYFNIALSGDAALSAIRICWREDSSRNARLTAIVSFYLKQSDTPP